MTFTPDEPRLPRGIRNNNPGNIRATSTAWRGERVGADPAFEVFATPEDGLRALARLLLTYWRRLGLRTVGAIVSRFAPPRENDTQAYIRHVAGAMGVRPDTPLALEDPAVLARLVKAIVRHENGLRADGTPWYDDATIERAVDSAMES